jgi:hypothetical protein
VTKSFKQEEFFTSISGKIDMVMAIINATYLLQQDIIFEDGFVCQTF